MQKTTRDAFLNGKFVLKQFKTRFHRAGVETIILASLVAKNTKGKVLDMGAGTGAIGFAVAVQCKNAKVVMAEKQKELVELMKESMEIEENKKFGKNINVKQIDFEKPKVAKMLGEQNYEYVVANPPFHNEKSRSSPFGEKKMAKNMKNNKSINLWIKIAGQVLKDKGTLVMLMKPDNLADGIEVLNKSFGNIRVLPLQAAKNKIAKRIIVMAQKNSKTPMTIQPPLVIHKENGGYTKEVENIVRGKI